MYNPQNDGVVFSKRWVPFHKTTRIFFEGFSFPLFLCLSDSVFFVRFLLFFVVLFDGCCFVCTFAANKH